MAKLTPHPCSQGERFIALDIDMKYTKEKVDKIENHITSIDEKLDSLIEGLDNRYAKKASVDKLWTIVWSVIGFFFMGAGGAILSLIFIKH